MLLKPCLDTALVPVLVTHIGMASCGLPWLIYSSLCRDEIVPPTNETVAQVFSRISAWRDSMDGPQFDDQGLLNTDPRTIAVPESYVNNIPTDIRGVSFSRTPAMVGGLAMEISSK